MVSRWRNHREKHSLGRRQTGMLLRSQARGQWLVDDAVRTSSSPPALDSVMKLAQEEYDATSTNRE